MKKVLAIAPYAYLPYYSGGQKFIAQFLEWLGRSVQLTVISVAENDMQQATTYSILPWLKRGFSRYYDRKLVDRISLLVAKEGFDTVIWEHPYYAWLAFRVRRRTGVRTIIHTHNIEYQRFRSTHRWWWPMLKWYEKWSFKKADHLLFITPEDRDFAIRHWKINSTKCIEVPFGITIDAYPRDRKESAERIRAQYGIQPNEAILLFSGLLSYKPNSDALKTILEEINPRLLAHGGYSYKLLVCGKGLPDELNSLKDQASRHILYAGFVSDIDTYYKAASFLLNPVQRGGGIKTKMVESIAYGCNCIATATGAAGIHRDVCGEKLVVVADNDWERFSGAILSASAVDSMTPASFYATYYWEQIIQRLLRALANEPSR